VKFGRKPYLVKVDSLDTATSSDIEKNTAGLKAVKTEKDGFILPGLLPPSVHKKVSSLNGLENDVSFVGLGNINISTERTKSGGLIKIEGLPPTFYPSVKNHTVRKKELFFSCENSSDFQEVLNLPFGISRTSDVHVTVTGKVRLDGIENYTPCISFLRSRYELTEIKSDCFSLTYLFHEVIKNPLLSMNLQVSAKPSTEKPGKVTLENVSLVINTLPKA